MGGTYQKVSPLDGFAGERQGMSDEDEYRINDAAMDLNEAHVLEAAAVSHIPVLEKLQHQSTAPIVRWDRFLPLRTLKVLLVENDDSTRQVVSALLRNCCYEVTAVANGLDAWRVLQDLTNHIDLVLSEVVIPGWSGIGLLCKIMSHKTCKTIPVIMMSSNGSMGIVFKCLSKGAVDFLVKPIRKNELKNLWQHVWRRCHSSGGSGSGSESGIEGQKFTKSKSEDDSDNNSGSNDAGNNGSIGLNASEGSDNGGGTQSSWTKRAFEADSACAHVIHPKLEPFYSKKKEHNIITDDDIVSTDLRNEYYQIDKFSTKLTGPSTEKFPENSPSYFDVVHPMNYNTLDEPSAQAPDQQSLELPSLELSLKRLRSNSIPLNDERNVLKHSNMSAFSRYTASAPTYGTNINVVTKPAFHPVSQEKIGESAAAAAPAIGQSKRSKKQAHVHALQPQIDQDGFSVDVGTKENITFRNSSNVFTMPQGEANCSLNGSNSGSNNGCSDAGGTNMDGGIGVAEKSGGNGDYQNRSAQREAALNKFRQKRKERNFGKKVRYQSRKRLAEQRPRVRGQFVRRITHEEKDTADS